MDKQSNKTATIILDIIPDTLCSRILSRPINRARMAVLYAAIGFKAAQPCGDDVFEESESVMSVLLVKMPEPSGGADSARFASQ